MWNLWHILSRYILSQLWMESRTIIMVHNKNKFRQTSINDGHKHFWKESNKFTTYDDGHRHKLNKSKRLAMKAGRHPHTHKLLRKLKGSSSSY